MNRLFILGKLGWCGYELKKHRKRAVYKGSILDYTKDGFWFIVTVIQGLNVDNHYNRLSCNKVVPRKRATKT